MYVFVSAMWVILIPQLKFCMSTQRDSSKLTHFPMSVHVCTVAAVINYKIHCQFSRQVFSVWIYLGNSPTKIRLEGLVGYRIHY